MQHISLYFAIFGNVLQGTLHDVSTWHKMAMHILNAYPQGTLPIILCRAEHMPCGTFTPCDVDSPRGVYDYTYCIESIASGPKIREEHG